MIINAGEKTADCNRPRTEHLPARRRYRREREVRRNAGAGDQNPVAEQRARVPGTHSMKALIVMRLVRQKKVLAGYETPQQSHERIGNERQKDAQDQVPVCRAADTSASSRMAGQSRP